MIVTVLLVVAALGTSWSSYQATRWNGEQAKAASRTNAIRIEAARAQGLGQSQTQVDVATFIAWANADRTGDQQLADFYVDRFRDEFRPAFETWRAGDALNSDSAVASPLLEPNYKIANFEKADALERTADRHFEAGKEATEHADNYIFATVFFAAVLFFSGISMRFQWKLMRSIVLLLALMCFVYGGIKVLSLPTH